MNKSLSVFAFVLSFHVAVPMPWERYIQLLSPFPSISKSEIKILSSRNDVVSETSQMAFEIAADAH